MICDAHEEADWLRAQGAHEEEIAARTILAQSGDPLDQYNLVVALAEGGYEVPLASLYECAARCAPWDPTMCTVLEVLADEVDDEDESRMLAEHAQALGELHGRQDQ